MMKKWLVFAAFCFVTTSFENVPMKCDFYERSLEISCRGGLWSSESTVFTETFARSLSLLNIEVSEDSVIPALPFLKILTLTDLKFSGQSTNSTKFPLTNFTQQLNRGSVRELRITGVSLQAVSKEDFVGMTGLNRLHLVGCNITEFYADTLEAFAFDQLPSFGELFHISIEEDQSLTSFPWGSLEPAAHVLTSVCLSNNSQLTSIDCNANTSCNFMLRIIRNVTIDGNALPDELPTAILPTLDGTFTMLSYQRNRNPCTNCGIFPALDWYRNQFPFHMHDITINDTHKSRGLDYSCLDMTDWSSNKYRKVSGYESNQIYSAGYRECVEGLPPITIPTPTSTSTSSPITKPPTIWGLSLTTVIISAVVGSALIVFLLTIWFCRQRIAATVIRRYREFEIDSRRGSKIHHNDSLSLADEYFPEDSTTKQEVQAITVPSRYVRLLHEPLGKGSHGSIVKATARGLKYRLGEVSVAVKVSNTEALTADTAKKLFVDEVTAMCQAGFHSALVNLLGVTKIEKKPALLLEFCEHGALSTFLVDHRSPFFYCHVDDAGSYLPFRHDIAIGQQATAAYLLKERETEPRSSCFDKLILSSKDLLSFAYQIARGMEYLAHRSIIHRDLAARNVLVAQGRVVKISDFGLARKGDNVYIMGSSTGLPVRWMPPEAMVTRCFAQSTDVWSFGVVLWELFSLGEVPYSEHVVTHGQIRSFVRWLEEGHRLDMPHGTPLVMYELMTQCWATRPAARPTFAQIRRQLDQVIAREVIDDYLQLNNAMYPHSFIYEVV